MLIKIGEASYQGVLSTASYYAIDKTLENNYNYENLFNIHKNEEGEIVMITADSYKFNSLTVKLADSVTNYMADYINSGVEVPIGVFSGIGLLQGFGKKVKMPLVVISSIKCEIISSFESAGINQTRHTLYVDVTPDAAVITKATNKKLVDNIRVMIYDNVIIGKVPEAYLAGSVFSAYKTL
ncbi:MAG: hypothetical protein IKV61_04865 [Clostridia bacterium]|nr:hypothetical protein [Clostridia bacterium]